MDLELELNIRVEQDIPSTARLTTESNGKTKIIIFIWFFFLITLFYEIHTTKKASACNSEHTTKQL